MVNQMRIGVLSDSHGRVQATAQAVRAVLDAGAEMLIHLGDFEDERVIDELVGHNARIVFGNCDFNGAALARYARSVGVAVDDPMGLIEIGSKRIAFTHGHLPHLIKQALVDEVDYLLHGHTHLLSDDRVGRTRVINPGALFRAGRYTAAVLDPGADRLEFVEVSRTI